MEIIRDGLALRLNELFIDGRILHTIDPYLVSSAVVNARKCRIYAGQPDHYQAIFSAINATSSHNLSYLELYGADPLMPEVRQVDPDILAEAAMKLETLKADLSSDQTEAVLTRLAATMDSRLKRLSLHKSINLESMDPVILAEALIKLEFIGVHWFRLSAAQLTSLISKIRHSPDMRIIMLCLNYTDLSPVPPEILIEALQKVKDVFIMFTRLTAEQFTYRNP